MKQKDIAVIVGVAGIATLVAFAIGNFVLAPPTDREKNVKVLDPISSTFADVDKRYLNDQSVNSTQTVQIGSNNNPTPFPKDQSPTR